MDKATGRIPSKSPSLRELHTPKQRILSNEPHARSPVTALQKPITPSRIYAIMGKSITGSKQGQWAYLTMFLVRSSLISKLT